MRKYIFVITCLFFALLTGLAFSDEGMIPISEIHKLDLKAKGLNLSAQDIFNPAGGGLIDAIIQFEGGTGSFVSPTGLIITNHHIAFSAIQAASSKEKDYVTHGLLASDRSREIQAKGYTVRITESYTDVSDEVLSVAKAKMDFIQRTRKIEKKIKEIILNAEKKYPGKRAEVAEMFPGKTYLLFIYTYLKDVRLVYAPPRGIGDFGGEIDNWTWPRHSGDFAFLRAYVAPDGKSADFSPENIPYKPRRFLQIAPEGVKENDTIFILGYPGRTYRHMTSHYLSLEERFRMPYIASLYSWQIEKMERMSVDDPQVRIKLAGRIKGLANTMKNYRSKLKGMDRLALVEKKRQQEEKLKAYIAADARLQAKYGSIFAESESIYREMEPGVEYETILDNLPRSVTLLSAAFAIVEGAIERGKKESDRENAYMSRNFARTKEKIKLSLQNYHAPVDIDFLSAMLLHLADLPEGKRLPAVDRILSGKNRTQTIDDFVKSAYAVTRLADVSYVETWLEKTKPEVERNIDPLIAFARELYPSIVALRELRRQRKGKLDLLYSRLLEVEHLYLKSDFIPDANSTLRFTSGRIKGYTPIDAVWFSPITTFQGILEKNRGVFPFEAPKKELDLFAARDFGSFVIPGTRTLPVAILYDADTTGGNSGSPVLNASGQLVGVNFDRTGEATVNDYAWSADYSRSIAVDIRYALWVTWKVAGARDLLKEMGIPVP